MIVDTSVGVGDNVAVTRLVFVGRGVTRMIMTDRDKVAVTVTVGDRVFAVKGMIGAEAGTSIIPMIPIIIRTKPLAELTIKSLGYFIIAF